MFSFIFNYNLLLYIFINIKQLGVIISFSCYVLIHSWQANIKVRLDADPDDTIQRHGMLSPTESNKRALLWNMRWEAWIISLFPWITRKRCVNIVSAEKTSPFIAHTLDLVTYGEIQSKQNVNYFDLNRKKSWSAEDRALKIHPVITQCITLLLLTFFILTLRIK